MMNLFKNTKVLGGAVVIVALLVVVYYYWGQNSAPSATLTTNAPSPASQDLLTMLSNLHSIQLDPSIFSDPLFTSLSDFGVTIPPEPTGRPNPFAPISSASTQSSAPKAGQ